MSAKVTRYAGMVHGFMSLEALDAANTALEEAASELRTAAGEAAPA